MNAQRLAKYCIIAFPYFICLYLLRRSWPSSWSSIKVRSYYVPNKIQNLLAPEPLPQSQPQPPEISDPMWQPVNGSRNAFAVYTAYSILNRPYPQVLIIGIKYKTPKDKIYCQYHYPDRDKNKKTKVRGRIEQLLVGSKTYFPTAGVFIRCPLPRGTSKPEMVSVLVNQETEVTNKLKINYLNETKRSPYKYQFSVCVKPAFDYNDVLPLLEWIEFHKLMGVEQFTLYNLTIGPEASCILNELVNGADPSITMNVLPWRNHHLLDQTIITDRDNVHQSSIAAAQNDCVYRHRGHQSKYMVFVDLDEFIMPVGDKVGNYAKLIHHLDSQDRKKKFGEYLFKNGFLIMSRPDDPTLDQRCSMYRKGSIRYNVCHSSQIMRKVTVEEYHPHKIRSKYIIQPEGVIGTSTHQVIEFEKGFTSLKVPEEIAFSRHYRTFEEGSNTETVRVPLDFGLELVENLSNRVEALMRSCGLNIEFEES